MRETDSGGHHTRLLRSYPIKMDRPNSNKFLSSISYQGLKLWSELSPNERWMAYVPFVSYIKNKIQGEMNLRV